MIDVSVSKADPGASLADQAGKNMCDVITSIRQVAGIIAEINTATKKQSVGIGQVKAGMVQWDDVK